VDKYPVPDGKQIGSPNSYLAPEAVPEDPMAQLLGHSITYRIAVGSQAGRKVYTLQTLPGSEPDEFVNTAGRVSGFSLHAGVSTRAYERKKLERLCRYISRPAVSEMLLDYQANWMIWEAKPVADTANRLKSIGISTLVYQPIGNVPASGDFISVMRDNLMNLEQIYD
jgi:hypothetical protein